MTSAVINEESFEARNAAVFATSSGVVRRLIGVSSIAFSAILLKASISRPSRVKADGKIPAQ